MPGSGNLTPFVFVGAALGLGGLAWYRYTRQQGGNAAPILSGFQSLLAFNLLLSGGNTRGRIPCDARLSEQSGVLPAFPRSLGAGRCATMAADMPSMTRCRTGVR